MSSDPFKDIGKNLWTSSGASKHTGISTQSIIQGARMIGTMTRNMRAAALRNQLKAQGYDPITVEAAVEAVKNGKGYEGILESARRAYEVQERQHALRLNPPPIHGSAAWATTQELTTANLLHPQEPDTGNGLHLGTLGDNTLYWTGESHLLTIAPTRTGKATMQIIPNLLRYKGSAVVLDPKGELSAATARWRADHVGPVYILDPFGIAPPGTQTHAFNPLDDVTTEQDATKLAEMIYPRTQDDRQRFFDNEAIGFLTAVILFTARYAPAPHRNFGTIRTTLSSLNHDFYGLLKAMNDPAMPEAIRNAARNVLTKTKDVGLPRLIDSLSQHLRIWDTPGLRQATANSDFDFKQVKNTPATVYLVLPFEELTTYSTYVQLIMAAALDAMIANPIKPPIPVLFILDEFLALEPNERFVNALRTHAGYGARLHFFLQDLPTLEQKYPTTWKSFLQTDVKTFFGTDDPFTAELISNYLGDRTVSYDTPGTSPSVGANAATYSITENLNFAARRLLTPPEVIRTLSQIDATHPRTAIHFMRGVPPVQSTLAPWWLDRAVQDRHSGVPMS